MRPAALAAGMLLSLMCQISAQSPGPKFEVASVKPWRPQQSGGALEQTENGLFTRGRITVDALIQFAFHVRPYEMASPRRGIMARSTS